MKLAIASLLRPLIAEHGAHIVELGYRVLGVQLLLDEGAHHRSRSFRSQSQGIAALVGKSIHLLFDDIGSFADGAAEEFGLFHHRHPNFGKAVDFKDAMGFSLKKLPGGYFTRQYIVHAFDACDVHGTFLYWFYGPDACRLAVTVCSQPHVYLNPAVLANRFALLEGCWATVAG